MRTPVPKALLSLALCATLAGAPPEHPPVTIELPPVPPYPKDGKIPDILKDRFVFLDEEKQELVVSFPSELSDSEDLRRRGGRITDRLPLRIGGRPVLEVSIVMEGDRRFKYSFRIENRPEARQDITAWRLPLRCTDAVEFLVVPDGWGTSVHELDRAFRANATETMTLTWGEEQKTRLQRIHSFRYVGWWSTGDHVRVIPPGERLGPFGFKTTARPGIVRPFFQGQPGHFGTRSGWPEQVGHQLIAFSFVESDSVSIPTIGPKFDASVDSSVIAKDFLSSIEGLVKNGELSRPSEFLAETTSILSMLARPGQQSRRAVKWVSTPGNILEQQIQMAIQISLGEM